MKKSHLPQKLCPVCCRPFFWRKKWKKVWSSVKYCSYRCQHAKAKEPQRVSAIKFSTTKLGSN